LNGATERIARIVGADVAAMVAEALNVNPEAITSSVRKRKNVDARHVVAIILRDDFGFTYKQIKNVICVNTNHAIMRAIGNAEVFEVNEKLQKVYKAYSWIKNTASEIF
jgi:chromosomal replication initiation ATPase DnaA